MTSSSPAAESAAEGMARGGKTGGLSRSLNAEFKRIGYANPNDDLHKLHNWHKLHASGTKAKLQKLGFKLDFDDYKEASLATPPPKQKRKASATNDGGSSKEPKLAGGMLNPSYGKKDGRIKREKTSEERFDSLITGETDNSDDEGQDSNDGFSEDEAAASIEGRHFLKLDMNEAPNFELSDKQQITIASKEGTFVISVGIINESSASLWKAVNDRILDARKYLTDEVFMSKVTGYHQQKVLELGNVLFTQLLDFDGYLREDPKLKKAMTMKAALNQVNIILSNADRLRQMLLKHKKKEQAMTTIPSEDDLAQLLLPIYHKDTPKGSHFITPQQHRAHIEEHIRSYVALAEGIRREALVWHAAIKAVADKLGKDKPLVMAVARHLSNVLGREKTAVAGETGYRTRDLAEGETLMLPSVYITHLVEGGHRCRCEVCEPEGMINMKKENLEEAKKSKASDLEEEVKKSMVKKAKEGWMTWAEGEAKKEALKDAKAKLAKEKAVKERESIKAEIIAEVQSQAIEDFRHQGWEAAYRTQWAASGIKGYMESKYQNFPTTCRRRTSLQPKPSHENPPPLPRADFAP